MRPKSSTVRQFGSLDELGRVRPTHPEKLAPSSHMQLDLLVLQTFGRLTGIRSFLDLLDGALPRSEWSDNEALKQRAEKENWEFNDFDVERQVLDERFRFWLPRYAA